ncbi:TPA: hypothetical protein G5T75_005012 [Salmonella enterica]|uniref:Uncharacterized protein n=1 Tax=Salmonella enterica TaxID=28901 RepID=A0A754B8T3_SALER|nr:hypothetical protein [Salmonella enterica]HAF8581027.1 hypothetical protein [Salmonella enterica]
MQGAQDTARQATGGWAAHPFTDAASRVFTHQTVASARNHSQDDDQTSPSDDGCERRKKRHESLFRKYSGTQYAMNKSGREMKAQHLRR